MCVHIYDSLSGCLLSISPPAGGLRAEIRTTTLHNSINSLQHIIIETVRLITEQ